MTRSNSIPHALSILNPHPLRLSPSSLTLTSARLRCPASSLQTSSVPAKSAKQYFTGARGLTSKSASPASRYRAFRGSISRLPSASSYPNPLGGATPSAPKSNSQRAYSPRVRAWKSHKTTTSTSRPAPLQARILSWGVIVIIGAIGTALFLLAPPSVTTRHAHHERDRTSPRQRQSHPAATMPAEILPGRPDTLTPEQEEKLKEFWTATLQVFGVLDQKAADETAPPDLARVDSSLEKKPKKKKLSLFSRKSRDDAPASPRTPDTAPHSAGGAVDADDKYGQTKEFHDALANMSPETLRVTFWSMVKHDQPDALLLRFLRARKWDVEKALVMMVSTMRWRAMEVHVDDDIIKNGELRAAEEAQGSDPAKKKLATDFLAQMRLGKSFLHGTDREDRPMCFVRVKLHRAGDQSEESLERYTVFVIESARMLLAPPVDTACVVFDMTGFSMANMDYAPVKFMIKCFEANYPESLGVVLVHKAPWVFQGIYKIIRSWLDPVVAAKVHFTNDMRELATYIPPAHIPRDLGGEEDWTYTYIEPVPGENDAMKDEAARARIAGEREGLVREFEKVTVQWIAERRGDAGDVDADATGKLRARRKDIVRSLRDNYWLLDPYVRARSYYDRVGILGEGGNLRFYEKGVPIDVAGNGKKDEKQDTVVPNGTEAPPKEVTPGTQAQLKQVVTPITQKMHATTSADDVD